MRTTFLLLAACSATACGPSTPEPDSPQVTMAVMTEIRPGTPLEDMLELLDQHLVAAMSGQMEGDALDEYRRAEAISDRLLEATMPFEWIPSENYSLESKLRQVQSSADRVLAQVRTGVPRPIMLQDLRTLRAEVARLRQIVAAGGTAAPVPVERLLAGDTTGMNAGPPAAGATPDTPAPPSGPRPLGTPVPPPGDN
jgi:hypothetical protein